MADVENDMTPRVALRDIMDAGLIVEALRYYGRARLDELSMSHAAAVTLDDHGRSLRIVNESVDFTENVTTLMSAVAEAGIAAHRAQCEHCGTKEN